MDLQGHVALVTGASRGIGEAIARRLAEAGADVAAGYMHDWAGAERLAHEIGEIGRRAVAVGGDVSDPAQVAAMLAAAEQALGPIDVLVSNAGIGPQQKLEEITVEDWDQVMKVNLRPAFLLAQRLTPGMRERGWGRLIFISSVAAFTGGVVGPHYATSKAGLMGLMHALAGPLAPHGVTVNVVAPALIEGGMTLPGDAEFHRKLAERVPVGRLGRPEEVAEAVLAIVVNPFITAQTISVDGGLFPR
jgi:3-oxoacyl-[acyl-carrier protein] reductase